MTDIEQIKAPKSRSPLNLTFALNLLNILVALTFVFSSLIGYSFTLIVETTIHYWIASLLIALVLSIILLYIAYRHHWLDDYAIGTQPTIINRILSLLPFLVLLPVFVIVFIYPTLQASFHSDLHSPLVDQIQFYTGQPRNIYIWSEPMNYYWLYHALIATLSHIMQIPDTQVWVIVNIVVLISTFAWIYRTLPYVLQRRRHPVLEAMLVVFILFSINLFGFFHSMVGLLEGMPPLSQVFYLIAPESFTDKARLASLLLKYPNYNSFPLSIMYTWIGIYLALKTLNGEFKPFDIILFCVSIAGGAAYLLIGGVFTIATLVFAGFGTWFIMLLWSRDNAFQPIRYVLDKIIKPYIWLWLICVIVFLPMVYYNVVTLGVFSGTNEDSSIQFILRNFDAILAFIGSYYPLAIFIFAGIWLVYQNRDKTTLFLLMFMLAHLVPSYFFNFVHGNEYKFVLLGVFPIALITARVMGHFVILANHESDNQAASQANLSTAIVIALYTLASINILGVIGQFQYLGATSSARGTYISQRYTFARSSNPLAEAFTWIREESAQDTLLIILPTDKNNTVSRDTNRAMLITHPVYSFSDGIEELDIYLEQLEQMVQGDMSLDDMTTFLDILLSTAEDHPIAIIVTPDIALYDEDDVWIENGFTLSFESDAAKIYYRE